MEDDAKSFLKRLTGFSLGPIISAFISFITVPVTTYFVAPEDFGKAAMYTLGFSISSLFIFLGLDQAFVREYNEQKNKSQLFWNSIILPLFFSLIVGAIYMIFYHLYIYNSYMFLSSILLTYIINTIVSYLRNFV